jgi:Holliday junction resolvase-like predicted endonuclease
VFVEVKTRHGERLGAAEESVSPAQAARLLRAAQMFLAERPELSELFWRIDVFSVTLTPSGAVSRQTHLPNAVLSS